MCRHGFQNFIIEICNLNIFFVLSQKKSLDCNKHYKSARVYVFSMPHLFCFHQGSFMEERDTLV